ncbi:MAG: ABC transporter ATP-binding protein [Halobacteriaceae archaeon]
MSNSSIENQTVRENADPTQMSQSSSIVSYSDIRKEYEDVVAIKDINLDVEEGEFVTFVGPSGCGKTTLLHLTAGLLEPTQGTVTVDGTDVRSDQHKRHKLGLVFQEPVLLEWRTVLKNVMLPIEILRENDVLTEDKETYQERARDLIELVGLEGFEESYPQELSGGMQQRVAICRSLVYDPPVLLMDEPFGSLDAFTREHLNEELLRIWRETEKTVLFVTHNLEEAVFLSDKVVVLSSRPGQIMEIIDVDLERPRTDETRTMESYHDLVGDAYSHFTDTEQL